MPKPSTASSSFIRDGALLRNPSRGPGSSSVQPDTPTAMQTPKRSGLHQDKTSFGSTIISTVSNGRRRQARLEDLDDVELENYSGEVIEMSRKKKITPKNAFELVIIDCTMERLKRDSLGISQGTPRITDTRSTDEIKRYASTLETCGKVHAMRVDGLQRDFTDLNENLERVAKGKRVAKRRPDPDEETEADDPDGPRDVANVRRAKEREAVPTRKARKPRKSHVVQNKELACPETEMNANLIARYWSLIGNVQPGVMKESWIHHSERVETAKNLNLIIDPYFTFNQRYSHMIPLDRRLGSSFNRERTEGPVSQDSNSAVVLTPKVLRTTAKQLIAQGAQLQINRRISVDTCVRFPGEQEKLLRKVADAVSKNQRRITVGTTALDVTESARLFEACCKKTVTDGEIHPAVDGDAMDESVYEQTYVAKEMFARPFAVTEDEPMDENVFTADGDTDTEMMPAPTSHTPSRSRSRTKSGARSRAASVAKEIPSPVPLLNLRTGAADLPTENNSVPPNPFHFDDDDPTPQFVHPRRLASKAPSEAGSAVTDRSNRYKSVMKEIPQMQSEPFDTNVKPKPNQTPVSSSKKGGRAEWPADLELNMQARQRVAKLMETSKKSTLKKLPNDISARPEAYYKFTKRPVGLDGWETEQIVAYLTVQTKTLQKNFEGNWLPDLNPKSDMKQPDICAAFRQVFDDSYDPDSERLHRIWAGNLDQDDNYSLSSEDLSDHEDLPNFDGTSLNASGMDVDEHHWPSQIDPALQPLLEGLVSKGVAAAKDSDAAPKDDLDGGDKEMSSAVPVVVVGSSPEQAVANMAAEGEDDGWCELLDLPGKTDEQLGIVSINHLRDGPVRMEGLEELTEEDYAPETLNMQYAENIAIRDCTGSGVKIGELKNGVWKLYNLLLKLREREGRQRIERLARHPNQAAEPATTVPYLCIGHFLEFVHLKLKERHHRHINPSIIFSCLLHLAYEKKLHLANTEDLKNLYVMTNGEFSTYEKQHPHLNRLTTAYGQRVLGMKLPSSSSSFSPAPSVVYSSPEAPSTSTACVSPQRRLAFSESDSSSESGTDAASTASEETIRLKVKKRKVVHTANRGKK